MIKEQPFNVSHEMTAGFFQTDIVVRASQSAARTEAREVGETAGLAVTIFDKVVADPPESVVYGCVEEA
ncbi:hypothetical protein C5748_04075 [Phyllobacterium phragmitis]|uniref:Uncharacterized protein n=1 Tax=Phyllobacterium phragmitis TaxID=2670329 RepID=A0A2S9IXW2_9HYPH|nr:hypothetical protein [Phyllobacterium phragmitis]PRD45376.1 hypothetical protein C5748_04075 [Phyllobacterium phragmitis]